MAKDQCAGVGYGTPEFRVESPAADVRLIEEDAQPPRISWRRPAFEETMDAPRPPPID